jgi:hypothetical protein
MPPTTLEALEAAALQLSAAERSQLAERLLVSLEEDDEIMLAWYAEAVQRGEAFARGEETAFPASEVIERLQAMISSPRSQ